MVLKKSSMYYSIVLNENEQQSMPALTVIVKL